MDKKNRFVVTVQDRLCKACGICVRFCPAKILSLHYQRLTISNPDACTGCKSCELRCPDFALEVSER